MLVDLKSNNPSQQAKAIIEVTQQEIDEAIPVIIKLLQSSDAMVRCNAAYALGQLDIDDIETTGKSLLELINDPEELVRSEVIETLGVLEDQSVKAYAANSLGLLGDETIIPKLDDYLTQETSLQVKFVNANLSMVS